MKILSQTGLAVGVNAAVVEKVINVGSDWYADGVAAEPATWWVGKAPVTADRSWD